MTTALAILTLLASANLFGIYAILYITQGLLTGHWVTFSLVAPAVFGAALAVAVLA